MSFTADRRYYLNSQGQAVEEGDLDAQSLLLAEGRSMPDADARKYGLIAAVPAAPEADVPAASEPETKAITAPPHTKAHRAPDGTK
jgi:hypothetical protein